MTTTTRIWPTVQALGRTIVCNRSDIIHQGVRAYTNHSTPNPPSPPVIGPPFHHTFSDEKFSLRQNVIHSGRGSYVKVITKKFSSGVQLLCHEFSDGENEHAHDVLRSLPAYQYTTYDPKRADVKYSSAFSFFTYRDEHWPAVGTDRMIGTLTYISEVLSLYNLSPDDKYKCLLLSLTERIDSMNDEQLTKVLTALSFWPVISDKNSTFDLLLKKLDEVCTKRLQKWDISKMFLIADHWYALRMVKLSVYFNRFISLIGIHILDMNPSQLVQFMFYVNLNREFGAIKMKHLEIKIIESLHYLSIEELGIIAMALFKTETHINSTDLINCIIEITMSNLAKISDHSLCAILKVLNKSLPGQAHSECYNILEKLSSHLHKFNNFVHMQAAIFGSSLLVFHKDVLCQVGARFSREISSLRLKDIERFTYILMLYSFIPPECPNILNQIIAELRKPERVVEINHFPRCFSSCVSYLVAMQVFPHDLISAALQPSMIQLLHLQLDDVVGREVNELNWTLKIEIPMYLGHKLDSYQTQQLTKRFMGRIPSSDMKSLSHQEKLLLDIKSKLEAMMGKNDCVEVVFILPHFSLPDLIFCTTHDGESVELPENYKMLPQDTLKPATQFEHLGLKWNAVMVGGRNSIIRHSQQLKGNLKMKKRQLAKLGYVVSVIPYKGYVKTSMKYKLAFLEKCLADSTLNLEGRKEMALDILKTSLNQVKKEDKSSSSGQVPTDITLCK